MKKLLFVLLLFAVGCSTMNSINYTPKDETKQLAIEVTKDINFFYQTFTLKVNGNKVAAGNTNIFSSSVDVAEIFEGKKYRMIVVLNYGLLQSHFDVSVLVDNELAAKTQL